MVNVLLCCYTLLLCFFSCCLPLWAKCSAVWAGRSSWIGCPYNFYAGESWSRRDGMFLFWSNAWVSLLWLRWLHIHAAWVIFFIDLTVASDFPLLCWYFGEDVWWWNPHFVENPLNDLDVNCGPSSDPIASVHLFGRILQGVSDWAWWQWCHVSCEWCLANRWQLMTIRKSCPAREQKSTVISWNSLDGLGFMIKGSLGEMVGYSGIICRVGLRCQCLCLFQAKDNEFGYHFYVEGSLMRGMELLPNL